MAIEKKLIPAIPWKGLYLDGVTVPGGMSKAENVVILADGSAQRRAYERTLAETITAPQSKGTKCCYELYKADATRYIFADVDNSETTISGYGSTLISYFATWTPTSGWAYTDKWTHTTGTTALVATTGTTPNETAIVAGSTYLVTVNVTQTSYAGAASSGWTYAKSDSTYDWTSTSGNSQTVWLHTWTHAASGGTTALRCTDFTVESGASYVISVYATHTAGTSLSVYVGDTLAGTITSTGTHEFVARYVTTASYSSVRFVPTNDWNGSISKTWPHVPSKITNWMSCKKLIDPAGANVPSNYDTTAGTHKPISWYSQGAELMYYDPRNWYAEATAAVSQYLTVSLGGTTAGVISASGEYTYTVVATNTTALTFTPTTAWAGTITDADVYKATLATASNHTKIIGGTVTGTTAYEVSWSTVVTDLTAGDAILPQWTTLQDRAFRVDGTNENYWFSDASDYHRLGVPAPDEAPVTANANTTGAAITAGEYNVAYTYVKKYGSGTSEYVVEGNASPYSNVTVSNNSITVAVVACPDTDVSHIRIYRTLYGQPGGYLYWEGEYANATATITLYLSDDEIRDINSTLTTNNDKPPKFKFVLGAGSRLWGITPNGVLHWSKLDEPELFPSVNYMTFDPKDGYPPTGMCALKSYILVFKRHRTWAVDMFSEISDEEGNVALAKNVVSTKVGCIANGSIQAVGNESAIWLSASGFILYDGGNIKNISAGGPDSEGNITPSRIQTVVNTFIAGGAENFISSVYHASKHLYHVNLLYRNAAGDTITDQRHFVYNLDTDTWTEYVYRDTTGTKQYEINFALAHDSIGQEVVLIPYLSTTTGTVTYVYQTEYDSDYSTESDDFLGDQGEYPPPYMFVDSSGNVYVVNMSHAAWYLTGLIVKTTSAGATTDLCTIANIRTAFLAGYSYTAGDCAVETTHAVFDKDNSCFYLKLLGQVTVDESGEFNTYNFTGVVRVTTAGVITLIKAFSAYLHPQNNPAQIGDFPGPSTSFPNLGYYYTHEQQYELGDMVLHSDGTMFVYDRGVLYKITTPSGTPSISTYYSHTGYTTTMACRGMGFCGDNLYIHYIPNEGFFSGDPEEDLWADYEALGWGPYPTVVENHYLGKFTDVTGTADFSSWLLGSGKQYMSGMLVVSDAEIYLYAYSVYTTGRTLNTDPVRQIKKLTYNGSNWDTLNVGVPIGTYCLTPDRIMRDSAGNFVYTTLTPGVENSSYVYFYDKDWNYISRILIETAEYTYADGIDEYLVGPVQIGTGSAVAEGTVYVSNYVAGEGQGYCIYRIYCGPTLIAQAMGGSAEFDVTDLTGVIVKIVSNYQDLGIPDEKRVSGCNLDIESKYQTFGNISIEPDYYMNSYVHTDAEATEPDGAVSSAIFTHSGRETWDTDGDFDSAVESWKKSRLDIEARGTSFRYSITAGDVPRSNHSLWRVRPPVFKVQKRGKWGREKDAT